MKNIILLIGVLALFSCKTPQQEIEKIILYNDSIGYWNYEWIRDRAEFYGFTFKFEKGGNISKYSFNKIENRRRLFVDYGGFSSFVWKVSNDSILILMDSENRVKIMKYNNDTIWLFDKERNVSSMLINVKGDLNIEN